MEIAGLPPGRDGVLSNVHLSAAIEAGAIEADEFPIRPENIQPASLDLRLGNRAYRNRGSFLPGTQTVEHKVKGYTLDELSLRDEGALLETNRPYLIPLKERLRLPPNVRGKANPKSSTGRLDVFTRVITDNSERFDEVAPGYEGPLYLEVVPLSFPVWVKEDLSLNQLRLSVGRAVLSDAEIAEFHASQSLLLRHGQPVPQPDLVLASGMFLGLDLRGDKSGRVGYRAREHTSHVDMTRTRVHEPDRFWEEVRREEADRILLTPKRFYLLLSEEAVVIPPALAAEMTAYDPTSGELRTHYAGFFDPGFGYDAGGALNGSRAALEVRAHDVPFVIEHGQRVCKLTFERMLEEPTILYGQDIGSSYQRQEETLGKHFALPRRAARRAGRGREAGDSGDQLPLGLDPD